MKQKLNNAWENFLQRRYAARLGRRYVMAAASVVFVSMIGCSQLGDGSNAFAQSHPLPSPSSLPAKPILPNTKLTTANTRFGFKLFSRILAQEGDKNVFISPASIAIALDMLYNGAAGSTQQAMARALELEGLTLSEINSSNAFLKALLEKSEPQVQLAIANSLWGNENFSFKPQFVETAREFYQAQVKNLNFQQPAAPEIINRWVYENTRGKINKIVEQLKPEEVLFLINAIYFQGKWTHEFDKKQTSPYPFYLKSGQQKKYPMMSQKGKYKYYENEQFQAVSLPYGKKGDISLYIFLPKSNQSLNSFYQNLNAENWQKWISQLSEQEGFIRLPRFRIDYEIVLNNALQALGMGEAFSNQANFSGMGRNLAISQVKHKTKVEVNEEGTEATATTIVGIVSSSVPLHKPFQMIVDRPFFCAIGDRQTGSILFMGSVVDPQA
jgi:serpin B